MKKVFVAGHKGMVGRAIVKELQTHTDIEVLAQSRTDLDLCNQADVEKFFNIEAPDEVILAAAKVGGISANNTFPADFIYENLQIQNNVINAAHRNDVQKLLFLGSACIYPRLAEQPMKEDALLTATLEPTNEPYAIAKIAGIKMCESYNRQYGRDYRSVMLTNLYGPGDNFHPLNSHVVPALIRRFHEAKLAEADSVIVWGSGKPLRDFLYVEDMVEASLFVHNLDNNIFSAITNPMLSHINIGTGEDITIEGLAKMIKDVVGFDGKLIFDASKPDGTPRKLMDVSLITDLGWAPKTPIQMGLQKSYDYFLRENTERNNVHEKK